MEKKKRMSLRRGGRKVDPPRARSPMLQTNHALQTGGHTWISTPAPSGTLPSQSYYSLASAQLCCLSKSRNESEYYCSIGVRQPGAADATPRNAQKPDVSLRASSTSTPERSPCLRATKELERVGGKEKSWGLDTVLRKKVNDGQNMKTAERSKYLPLDPSHSSQPPPEPASHLGRLGLSIPQAETSTTPPNLRGRW